MSFASDHGRIAYKERVRADDGQLEEGAREPTAGELDHLRKNARQAAEFIARYVPPDQRQTDLLDNLEIAFAAWRHTADPAKTSAAAVESMFGAALGQYCIERLPVRWAVAVDSRGEEFVIVGKKPPSRAYPMASVRYRIEDGRTDFIGALYETLVHLRRQDG